jgi:hypothetical protein
MSREIKFRVNALRDSRREYIVPATLMAPEVSAEGAK